jgi:hypothetical protein
MANRQQLEMALMNAHKAGDTQAARQLAQAIKQGMFEDQATPQVEQPTQQPEPQTGFTSPIARVAQSGQQKRAQELSELRALSEQSGVPLARDIDEIGGAPEMGDFSKESFIASAGTIFTMDDNEVASIIENQLGAEILNDAEGNIIARLPSGDYAINKPGVSSADLLKTVGLFGAFSPAGRAKTLATQTGGAVLTQAGIEAGQELAGGDFDVADVAIPAVATPAVAGLMRGAQSLRQSMQPRTPTAPKPKAPPLFGQESKNTQRIREAVEAGDESAARFTVDSMGKVSANVPARALMKQGTRTGSFDPGKVAWLSTSQPADVNAFKKMLDIVGKGRNNARFAATNRPGKVIGDTLLKRFQHLKQVNQKAGKDLNTISKSMTENINLSTPRAQFLDELAEHGVSVSPDGKLNFALSTFEDNPASIEFIETLMRRMQRLGNNNSGLSAHRFKRFIDTQVEFGKKATNPIVGDAERLGKNLRRSVNEQLRSTSDDYAKANDVFSETVEALNDFAKIGGRNFDPESPLADEFMGKLARRMLSNAQSREPLIDAIHAIDKLSKKHGGQFDGDIATQLMFVEELEKTFGSFAQTSFQGGIEKSVRQAVTGDKAGIVSDVASKAIQKSKGLNEQNALKALRKFVANIGNQ